MVLYDIRLSQTLNVWKPVFYIDSSDEGQICHLHRMTEIPSFMEKKSNHSFTDCLKNCRQSRFYKNLAASQIKKILHQFWNVISLILNGSDQFQSTQGLHVHRKVFQQVGALAFYNWLKKLAIWSFKYCFLHQAFLERKFKKLVKGNKSYFYPYSD